MKFKNIIKILKIIKKLIAIIVFTIIKHQKGNIISNDLHFNFYFRSRIHLLKKKQTKNISFDKVTTCIYLKT